MHENAYWVFYNAFTCALLLCAPVPPLCCGAVWWGLKSVHILLHTMWTDSALTGFTHILRWIGNLDAIIAAYVHSSTVGRLACLRRLKATELRSKPSG